MSAEVVVSAHCWRWDHPIVRGPVRIDVHFWIVRRVVREFFPGVEYFTIEVVVKSKEGIGYTARAEARRGEEFMAEAKE